MFNWFKRRRQLESELIYYQIQLRLLRNWIKSCNSIDELRNSLTSNINQQIEKCGYFKQEKDVFFSGWLAKLLVVNFHDIIKQWDAENYVEVITSRVSFHNNKGEVEYIEPYVVTIKKKDGESPTEQIKKLKSEILKLQEELLNNQK